MDSNQAESQQYGFPYTPYEIQREFMRKVYETLNAGGLGLFESPTGTGKTLSLLCATLAWLTERSRQNATSNTNFSIDHQSANDDLPPWMATSTPAESLEATVRLSRASIRQKKSKRKAVERSVINEAATPAIGTGNLELYDSLSTGAAQKSKRRRLDESSSESGRSGEDGVRKNCQVYFCSRTHSQLSQTVGELRRTQYARTTSMVALASRQALCINKDVLKLKTTSLITEKCMDLQKTAGSGKEPTKAVGCPFRGKDSSPEEAFRDRLLGDPMDVEDLSRVGMQMGCCPYYASRAALPGADLVLLPYSSLLSEEARDALGLQLRGSVIIIDEAHNLVNALNAVHSATLHLPQLQTAHTQLTAYFRAYQSRLSPESTLNIQLLLKAVYALGAHLQRAVAGATAIQAAGSPAEGGADSAAVSTVDDFLFQSGVDNVNFFALARFAREKRLFYKVAGLASAVEAKETQAGSVRLVEKTPDATGRMAGAGSGLGVLHGLLEFFDALKNRSKDGRIITDRENATFKFILLDATSHFAEVLDIAHAVILASGTLAPMPLLQKQLFPDRAVTQFSCGHIIPREQLLALALGRGPSGAMLDFRHLAKSQPAAIEQLGRLLVNVCQVVPEGVVVFFSSHNHAAEVRASWQGSGLWAQLESKKQIFVEPRTAGEVEGVLREYSRSILGQNFGAGMPAAPGRREASGAMLLCVVGGRMSEGINFGDGLGRCVVMVGMPFPNLKDPELQERMRYAEREAGELHTRDALPSGSGYYEDLCMKAVNQCIGRVIRHKADWAAVLLLDVRWAASGGPDRGPLRKLPGWIQESLAIADSFGSGFARLAKFCRERVNAAA